MKTIFILIIAIVTFLNADIILQADFETIDQNYSLPNGGVISTNDFFTKSFNSDPVIVHEDYSNVEGSFYLSGRDIQLQTGFKVGGELILDEVDVTSCDTLSIQFLVGSTMLEEYESIFSNFGSDYIIGEYSYDGGIWFKFAQFTGNDSINEARISEDTDFDGIGDGIVLENNLQEFSYDLPKDGTILSVRFLIYTGSGMEEIALDNIRISALIRTLSITTQDVTGISKTTATGNGNIDDLGAPDPTAHGVCWSLATAPTITDSFTDEGSAFTTGAFTSLITDLSAETTYFVRAYATNDAGIVYGNEVSFMTSPDSALIRMYICR